jgi:hypothetical protein
MIVAFLSTRRFDVICLVLEDVLICVDAACQVLHREVVTCLVSFLSARHFDVNLLLFWMISSLVLRLHVQVLDSGLVSCFRSFSHHEVDKSAHIQLNVSCRNMWSGSPGISWRKMARSH